MSKDLYNIVANKVVEFCKKTYPYDCFVKFEISYDGKEWDKISCVVECDIDYNIVFQWDFCEGQKHIRHFRICHTDEAEIIKHGRWITVSDGYGNGVATASICECSLCKDTIWVYKNDKRKWNYCPNCGARMDAQIGEDKSHPFAESVMMGMEEVEE